MVFSRKKKEVNLAKILSSEQTKEPEKPQRKSMFFNFGKGKGYREDDWGKYQFHVAETESQEYQRKEKVKQIKSTPTVLERVSAFFYGELETDKKTRSKSQTVSVSVREKSVSADSSPYVREGSSKSRSSRPHSLTAALSPQKILPLFNELSTEMKITNANSSQNPSESRGNTHPRMSRIRTSVHPDQNFKFEKSSPEASLETGSPSAKNGIKQRRRGRTDVTSSRLPNLEDMRVDTMRKIVKPEGESVHSSPSKEAIEKRSISKGTVPTDLSNLAENPSLQS